MYEFQLNIDKLCKSACGVKRLCEGRRKGSESCDEESKELTRRRRRYMDASYGKGKRISRRNIEQPVTVLKVL